MNVNNKIKSFYQQISNDKIIKEKIIKYIQKSKSLNNEESRISLIKNVIIPEAKKQNLNFSIDDLLQYEKQYQKIDDQTLENISGGANQGLTIFCLGALISISTLIGSSASAIWNDNDTTIESAVDKTFSPDSKPLESTSSDKNHDTSNPSPSSTIDVESSQPKENSNELADIANSSSSSTVDIGASQSKKTADKSTNTSNPSPSSIVDVGASQSKKTADKSTDTLNPNDTTTSENNEIDIVSVANAANIKNVKPSKQATEQKDIIDIIKNNTEQIEKLQNNTNFKDLEKLTNSGFTVSGKSFSAFIEELQNQNPANINLEIDLFESNNLDVILTEGLSTIIYNQDNKSFIGKNNLPTHLIDNLIVFLEDMQNKNEKEKEKFIFDKLTELSEEIKNDSSIQKNNGPSLFIDGMKQMYKVDIARKLANEFLEQNRENIEKICTKNSSSSKELELTTSGNISGIPASFTVGVNKTDSTSSSDYLYSTSIGIKFALSLGFSNDIAKLSIDNAMEMVYTEIYFSAEQFLDSKIPKSAKLNDSPILLTKSNRKKMQEEEKRLKSIFNVNIISIAKAFNLIPKKVSILFPDVTRSKIGKKTISGSATLSFSTELFSIVGFETSASYESSKNIIEENILSLIDEYCNPSNSILNQKIIIDEIIKSDAKALKELKNFCEIAKKSKNPEEQFNILYNNFSGTIRQYVNTIGILSNSSASKEEKKIALKTKHSIDQKWGYGKVGKNKGRRGVYKSMISAACLLKSYASQTKQSDQKFNSIYQELSKLHGLQEFSKNKGSKKGLIDLTYNTKSKNFQGKATLKSPYGDISIFINLKENTGITSSDNRTTLSIDINVPGKVDIATQRKLLTDFYTKISEIFFNKGYERLGQAFNQISTNFNEQCNFLKNTFENNSIGMEFYNNSYTLSIKLMKNNRSSIESQIALPNTSKIIDTNKSYWSITQMKISQKIEHQLSLGEKNKTKVKSSKVKLLKSKLGTDSLIFLVDKYNACSGDSSSDNPIEKNTLWKNFTNNNTDYLFGLISKIKDESSNPLSELQKIYSSIIKSRDTSEEERIEIEKTFSDFIKICSKIKSKKSSEFKTAIKLFEKILEYNYEKVYSVESNIAMFLPKDKAMEELKKWVGRSFSSVVKSN